MSTITLPIRDVYNELADQLRSQVGATGDMSSVANAIRCAAAGQSQYAPIDPLMNYPSPAELERLALIAEECSEVIQSITKIIRFGKKNGQYDNYQQLEKELGDVSAAVNLAAKNGDLVLEAIERHAEDKLKMLPRLLRFT